MSFDLLAHTRAHIDPTYYARGSSYYQNGMVTIDDIDFMSDAMTTLYGEVQGTRLYETAIGIMYHAKTGLHIEYQCDCPAYHDHLECKHCAAFAMAVADRYMISDRGVVTERWSLSHEAPRSSSDGASAFSPTHPIEVHNIVETTDIALTLAIPTLPPSRLELLRESLPQTDLIYKTRLALTQYRGQQELYLSLYECAPLKNGNYGKGKELFQSSSSRIPSTHRQSIPFLSHGSWYYGNSYATRLSFRDAPEMFLSILRDAEEVSDVDGDGVFHLADNIGILTFERENGKKKAFLLPRIRDEAGILHQIHKAYTFFSHHSLHLTLLPWGILLPFVADLPIAFLASVTKTPLEWTEELSRSLRETSVYLEKLLPYIADPQDFDIEVDTSIVPRIRIDIAIPEELTHITLRIGVEYGDSTLWGIDTSAYVITPTGLIARQREHETLLIQALTPLFETGRFITADTTRMEIDEGIDLFFEGIDRLEATGNYHITYLQEAHRVSQANIGVKVSVSSGIDWFDTEVALEIDAIQADIGEQLLEAAKHHRRYITLDDGTILMLRDHIRASLSALDALGINVGKSGTQKIGRYMIGALDPGKDTTLSFILDREAIRLRKSLMHFKSLPKVPIPTTLQATLREYQEIGYSWIHFLESERFSGILADDMGLGKTIQTITFLIEFFARNTEQQPVLIICPTSLLFNWRSEFERFAPHIRTMSVTSGKWDGTLSDAQVIITSYGIIQRSVDIFTTLTWSALILDEAQNIKNAHSVRAKNIRLLSARFRLALSGTPIENHLFELKSLFDVLMPGFLGSDADFKRRYMGGDRNELMLLSKKIKPFILRRTKEVVAKDLPPKVEEIISLDMDEDQARYYDSIKSAYQKKVMRQVADEGIAKAQFMVLEALMRMRQACLSPALIDPKRWESSVKLTYLEENIDGIIEAGHSLLIFSQFPSFLTHVRRLLEKKWLPYHYLDGKTKDRQSLVESFQRGERRIFLISLKAGGTGLNLVSADYVIHLDPWWNPAVEAQATDRAHRIGQTKTVFVQKLIVRGTIEEKVLELQKKKKQIVSDIFSGDWSGKLTKGDLEYIFA